MQLILTLPRLGRQDVPRKRMLADNLSRPGLFEPFRRTFVGLQFGHDNVSGKLQAYHNRLNLPGSAGHSSAKYRYRQYNQPLARM
jgi:hypothetical protein